MEMNERLVASIAGKKRELDRHRPLSISMRQKLREQFALEWTYNSNAIEGNTLTLQETEIVLKHGLTIGGKTVHEHLEAINHQQGIDYIEEVIQKKRDLNGALIRQVHYLILKGIDDANAGIYRRQAVRIMGAFLIPPQAVKVPSKMEELVSWYYEQRYELSVPELAAGLHYRFVCIHPFIDGNGRVARLLMNLVLMAQGYPPAVILSVDRQTYYRVLNEANRGRERPFADFVGRAIERSLIIYLNSVKPDLSEKERFIPLREAVQYCDYSQEYLSLLARKGKLSAIKLNREWLTTREAVEEYVLLHGQKKSLNGI